jgi:hypothetical protein
MARPFYEVTVTGASKRYEMRVWLDEDLPDFNNDVTAMRTYGDDSRGPDSDTAAGLLWGKKVSLCDVTAHRGHC